MRKKTIITLSLIGVSSLFLSACSLNLWKDNSPTVIEKSETAIAGKYNGSLQDGNYIWGAAMNFAWTELSEKIIKDKIKLEIVNKESIKMQENFNNPVITTNDLDEESYYIKAGYGQETVNQINTESKAKFPDKSFSDLDLQLGDEDIISYAYFLKKVEYEELFENKDVSFLTGKYKGFSADEYKQKQQIKILHYENDDKFIIKIKLKDNADELILAKGYDMTNPTNVVAKINEYNNNNLPSLGNSEIHDYFKMPKLKFNIHRNYEELIGKKLENAGFQDYMIAQMFENIKFEIDEKGAKVENEGVIRAAKNIAMPPQEIKERYFFLNKPFWVIMKRTNSENPYFILGINNDKFMKRK